MSAARSALNAAQDDAQARGSRIPWCDIARAVETALRTFAVSGDRLWHRVAAKALLPLVTREIAQHCGEDRGLPDKWRARD